MNAGEDLSLPLFICIYHKYHTHTHTLALILTHSQANNVPAELQLLQQIECGNLVFLSSSSFFLSARIKGTGRGDAQTI